LVTGGQHGRGQTGQRNRGKPAAGGDGTRLHMGECCHNDQTQTRPSAVPSIDWHIFTPVEAAVGHALR
jgi:hypothetical protein